MSDIGGRYRLGSFIGRGASGDVHEGVDTVTGERVAIKCVDCRRFRSIAELEAVQEEAALLLHRLRHRHIVKLLAVHSSPSGHSMYLVMEHCGGGTLQQLLRAKEGHQLGEAEALRIFAQIFKAVEYCHRRCVVHRDLKPENVLLDAAGNVKVADLGLASMLTPLDGEVFGAAGTAEFMAPDLLVSQSCDGAKADQWSMGCMLYEALAGRTPFSGLNLVAIMRAALRNEYAALPEGVSPECRDLVARLLQPDPAKRISVEQALAHPWLRQAAAGCPTELALSPLPSCSEGDETGVLPAGEDAREGRPAAGAGAGDGQAVGDAPTCGAAAQPLPVGRSSRVAGRNEGSGSGMRTCSGGLLQAEAAQAPQPPAWHSSLALQLPGMPAAIQEEEEPAPPQQQQQQQQQPSERGSPSSSRPASRSRGLVRGRSLGLGFQAGSASPSSRLVKSASSKAFSTGGAAQPAANRQ